MTHLKVETQKLQVKVAFHKRYCILNVDLTS